MNDNQERKLDKFRRQSAFMTENAADFPLDSPGDKAAKQMTALITEIQTVAAAQVSGFDDKAQAFANAEQARENVEDDLKQINLAARAFSGEVTGIENKFRLPRRPSDEALLATARSFLADSEPHKAKFIEYGLAGDFIADLQTDIEAFEQAAAAADTAGTSHAEATGALADAFKRGMDLSRKLDAIVKIKYRNNPAKLAAWTVASHLERAPQKKKDEPPTT